MLEVTLSKSALPSESGPDSQVHRLYTVTPVQQDPATPGEVGYRGPVGHGPIAQGIEQRFPKPCVASSNLAGVAVDANRAGPPPAETDTSDRCFCSAHALLGKIMLSGVAPHLPSLRFLVLGRARSCRVEVGEWRIGVVTGTLLHRSTNHNRPPAISVSDHLPLGIPHGVTDVSDGLKIGKQTARRRLTGQLVGGNEARIGPVGGRLARRCAGNGGCSRASTIGQILRTQCNPAPGKAQCRRNDGDENEPRRFHADHDNPRPSPPRHEEPSVGAACECVRGGPLEVKRHGFVAPIHSVESGGRRAHIFPDETGTTASAQPARLVDGEIGRKDCP